MTAHPMMQEVQNPELMYQGPALLADMRERLLRLGYAPHATGLLMAGLPLVYSEDDALVIEYPDGHRLQVERLSDYEVDGTFRRYRYEVIRALPPAAR